LVSAGARVCKTAAQVAERSNVVILCVTGAPQVEAVLTGADGVLQGLKRGTIVIDCSTSLPDTSVKMAAALKDAGGEFLDAAMTKLPQHAQAGTLNLLVGGDGATLTKVRPILETFSENITHVGPVGAGHRMKLLHNYVSIGFMSLLAEVGAHAQRARFDPAILVDVLAKGGGAGAALDRMTPFLTKGDASNVPFFVSNAAKDLAYYCEMAGSAGVYRQIADAVSNTLQTAVGSGHGGDYIPQLAALLRESGPK
jgi:3-hydroxyisobutyrate dehydrogenase-like beta-hydroxyacid dehydrogenase